MRQLGSVRKVRSSTYSRNVPVHAFSMTIGDDLTLESGLEHQLMMMLDRDLDVAWLVAQPFLLRWSPKKSHYPDLLSVRVDGSVTVWDARPAELQDIDFNWKVEKTAEACITRGWRHRVFPGLSGAEEVNLRWLSMARRQQPWMPAATARLREITHGAGVTFGDIAAADEGGYLLSTLWHLAWRGDVELDLADRWSEDTPVVWAGRS
ncbi:TnsA-like heteromeric transposase endonuclease subunit [Janibacter hoylei]|uniref:TnsA-like heteromeric transposase endonuclease subunit n=1 Tax=Janibacter hoylei TaxID=364298 RepID=UPI0021A5C307|nr:TnsA-like heteromeric transposase endonuclease subunit [Janibacter hoylei]